MLIMIVNALRQIRFDLEFNVRNYDRHHLYKQKGK